MGGYSAVHDLDALDLAAIWPVGGQPVLAPVQSEAQGAELKAGGRGQDRC